MSIVKRKKERERERREREEGEGWADQEGMAVSVIRCCQCVRL